MFGVGLQTGEQNCNIWVEIELLVVHMCCCIGRNRVVGHWPGRVDILKEACEIAEPCKLNIVTWERTYLYFCS